MAAGFEVRNHSVRADKDISVMFTIQVLVDEPHWADVDLDAACEALTVAYASVFAELSKRIEIARAAREHTCPVCAVGHTIDTATGWRCLQCGSTDTAAPDGR